MKKQLCSLVWLLGIFVAGSGQQVQLSADYLNDSFPALVKKADSVLSSAYMAQTLIAVTDTIPGWEGFPVQLYAYKTGVDLRTGQPKNALVYLLDPSPEKLAMWVATTCLIVKKSTSSSYTDQVLNWVMHQSGGQFPVKGVVYEDQYVKGYQEPYLFKDGVTVYIKDTTRWSEHGPLSKEQLHFAIQIRNKDIQSQTGQYARICSTTREDYLAGGGTLDVGDKTDRRLSWLTVVRSLYQQAWNSSVNPLMVMWAKQHLK